MSALITSDRGVFALALHEGIVPAPYRDSVGVWTYGIGHTAAAGDPDPQRMSRGMPADLDAAILDTIDLFRRDLARYEAAVRAAVKAPLSQHQFDALVSFHYNTGAIARATLTKRINAGDLKGAASAFDNWRRPPEIKARRDDEKRLFRAGIYPVGKIPVWRVGANGKVIWRTVRQLDSVAFRALLAKYPTEPRR